MKTLSEFSLSCQKFNYQELEKIQKAIFILKMFRYLDRRTFHAIAEGDVFRDEVLKPLEELTGWNVKNEKAVQEIAEQLKNEHQFEKRTVKENVLSLKKILGIGGGLAGLIVGGIALVNHKKKKP